jgi:sortase A
VLRCAVVVLLATAAANGGRALWIEAKACLAQQLVRRAWCAMQAGAGEARPWPWADTWPIARLTVPARGVDLFVLAGASGRTLAFGPGHVTGTALPGEPGNAVVSGHRDTHFAFLRELEPGDTIVIERRDGRRRTYTVSALRVVDHQAGELMGETQDARLTLVTCYPFDALRPGGPLRYVVTALEDEDRRLPLQRARKVRKTVQQAATAGPASCSSAARTPSGWISMST